MRHRAHRRELGHPYRFIPLIITYIFHEINKMTVTFFSFGHLHNVDAEKLCNLHTKKRVFFGFFRGGLYKAKGEVEHSNEGQSARRVACEHCSKNNRRKEPGR